MAFHFALATVLRARETFERREQMALDQCYRQLYSVQKQLSETDGRLASLRSEYEACLAGGTKAATLRCLDEESLRVERRRLEVLKQLMQAQQVLRQQLESYHAARQKREVVSELRRSAYREWTRKESQREQRFADDLFLSRRSRRK